MPGSSASLARQVLGSSESPSAGRARRAGRRSRRASARLASMPEAVEPPRRAAGRARPAPAAGAGPVRAGGRVAELAHEHGATGATASPAVIRWAMITGSSVVVQRAAGAEAQPRVAVLGAQHGRVAGVHELRAGRAGRSAPGHARASQSPPSPQRLGVDTFARPAQAQRARPVGVSVARHSSPAWSVPAMDVVGSRRPKR